MNNSNPLSQLRDPALLRTDSLVNGVWEAGQQRFEVNDPATGETLATVANLSAVDGRVAIDAASTALPAWRRKTAKERSAVMMKWFHLITQHADDLARIMTAEQGKPLGEARARFSMAPVLLNGLLKKHAASTAK